MNNKIGNVLFSTPICLFGVMFSNLKSAGQQISVLLNLRRCQLQAHVTCVHQHQLEPELKLEPMSSWSPIFYFASQILVRQEKKRKLHTVPPHSLFLTFVRLLHSLLSPCSVFISLFVLLSEMTLELRIMNHDMEKRKKNM